MRRQAENRNRNRNRNCFLLRLTETVVSKRCALLLKTLLISVTTNQYHFRGTFIRLIYAVRQSLPYLCCPHRQKQDLNARFIDLKVIVEPSLAGTITSLHASSHLSNPKLKTSNQKSHPTQRIYSHYQV